MAGYSVTFSVVDQATRQIESINQRIRQMREPMERQARSMQRFVDATGLRKVADGFGGIARAAGNAFSSMARLVPVMGALTGAGSIAGLVGLINKWGEFGLALQRDADRIGTTSQHLQRLQDATRLSGSSISDMTESLKGLTDTAAAAFTGDVQAAAWFQRAGIALTDVNGRLRSSTELLPEVLRYLDGFKNPTDRMRAAIGLGGQALYNLDESFRRSGQTIDQWLAKADRFTPLTDRQIDAQRRYKQAIEELNVGFDHLGQQVTTSLQSALTPFIEKLGTWVTAHQPQIIKAVDDISTAFVEWLDGVDIDALISNLGDLARILRDVLRIIGQIARAAAPLISLLTLKRIQPTAEEILAGSPLAAGLSQQERADILAKSPGAQAPAARPSFGALARGEVGVGSFVKQRLGLAPPTPPPVPPGASKSRGAALANQAIDYFKSRGWTHEQASGIAANLAHESSWDPKASGDGGRAYGLGQWHPDRQANFRKVFGKDIRQSSHEEQLAFVDWELNNTEARAGRRLRGATGAREAGGVISQFYERPADVQGNVRTRGAHAEQLAAAAARQGLGTQLAANNNQPAGLSQAGAPAAPPPQAEGAVAEVTGGAPVSGSVDITVTHRNPPPGATVAAAGQGDVNVGAPRTEQQQLAAA